MIEETEYTEEVRQQLLAEIASMKKQSLFSLVFTVACIIGMAYFYVELRKSRDELITEKQKVQQQKTQLERQNQQLAQQKNHIEELYELINDNRADKAQGISTSNNKASKAADAAVFVSSYFRENPAEVPVLVASLSPRLKSAAKPHRKVSYYVPFSDPAIPAVAHLVSKRKDPDAAESPFDDYIIYIMDARLKSDDRKDQAIANLQRTMKKEGALLPKIRTVRVTSAMASEVRYFDKLDLKTANAARKLLADLTGGTVKVVYQPNPRKRAMLEIWIGDK